jgi:hypothetical protein
VATKSRLLHKQVKKAEMERAEYVTKREKSEEWTKTFVDGWYQRARQGNPFQMT